MRRGAKWVCSVVMGSGEFGALTSGSVLIWDVEHENQAAWGQGVRRQRGGLTTYRVWGTPRVFCVVVGFGSVGSATNPLGATETDARNLPFDTKIGCLNGELRGPRLRNGAGGPLLGSFL